MLWNNYLDYLDLFDLFDVLEIEDEINAHGTH